MTINVANQSASATITATIADSATTDPLTKTGPGTLVLSGQNAFTDLTVAGGTLALGADDALPSTTILQLGDPQIGSGVLDLNGHDLTLGGLLTGDASTANNTYWDELTNTSTTAATLTLYNTADYTFTGFFSRNLSIDKYGPGKFTTTGANHNMGAVTVYDGTLDVEGYFLACPTTVPGFGNPQLVGQVDPSFYVVILRAAVWRGDL